MPGAAGVPPDASTEKWDEQSSASVSILVVDDDAPLRELIAAALTESGYTVRAAVSAEAAVLALHTPRFDLVLSDVSMPGMDGIALSSMIARTRPDLPVVLIIGKDEVPPCHRSADSHRRASDEHHLFEPLQLIVRSRMRHPVKDVSMGIWIDVDSFLSRCEFRRRPAF